MSRTYVDVAMQFDDADQQRSAAAFGMWVFLATEVLFFGGMFVAYAVYRSQFSDAFHLAGQHLNLWAGGVMTAVLLAGSLLVAMSDHLIEQSANGGSGDAQALGKTIFRRLALTAVLGVVFLSLEFYEYYTLIDERLFPGAGFDNALFSQLSFGGRSAQLFYVLFFCMTGLHGLHMIIGISLVGGLAIVVRRSRRPNRLQNTLKVIGLYWHFVDIIWLFLYPLFYLVQ